MKRVLFGAAAIAFFPAMLAIDSWFFHARFKMSYADWYVANGTLISVAASLFTVVWKDLNKNTGLIATEPRAFLSANLELIGVQFVVIGTHLEGFGAWLRARRGVPVSDLVDGVTGLLAALLIASALIVWFVAIVPLQYFIVLIAGAPARLALKLKSATADPARAEHDETPAQNEMSQWNANFTSAPVSATNAVAALVILAVKLARASVT